MSDMTDVKNDLDETLTWFDRFNKWLDRQKNDEEEDNENEIDSNDKDKKAFLKEINALDKEINGDRTADNLKEHLQQELGELQEIHKNSNRLEPLSIFAEENASPELKTELVKFRQHEKEEMMNKLINEEDNQKNTPTIDTNDNDNKINKNNNIEEEIETANDNDNFKNNFLKESDALYKQVNPTPIVENEIENTTHTEKIIEQEPKYFASIESAPSESFPSKFLEYAKSMSQNEIKALAILINKDPSALTKNNKDMIEKGLEIAVNENQNFNNLSNEMKAIIRTNAGLRIGTDEIRALSKINMASKDKSPLDKTLFMESMPKTIDKLISINTNENGRFIFDKQLKDSLQRIGNIAKTNDLKAGFSPMSIIGNMLKR